MIIVHLALSLKLPLHPRNIVRADAFTGLLLDLLNNLFLLLLDHLGALSVDVLMAADGTPKVMLLGAFRAFIVVSDFDALFFKEVSAVFMVLIIKVTNANAVRGPVMVLTDRPVFAENAKDALVPPIVIFASGTVFADELNGARLTKPIVIFTARPLLALESVSESPTALD